MTTDFDDDDFDDDDDGAKKTVELISEGPQALTGEEKTPAPTPPLVYDNTINSNNVEQ